MTARMSKEKSVCYLIENKLQEEQQQSSGKALGVSDAHPLVEVAQVWWKVSRDGVGEQVPVSRSEVCELQLERCFMLWHVAFLCRTLLMGGSGDVVLAELSLCCADGIGELPRGRHPAGLSCTALWWAAVLPAPASLLAK